MGKSLVPTLLGFFVYFKRNEITYYTITYRLKTPTDHEPAQVSRLPFS